MSYSFRLLAQVNCTRTRWPAQVVGGLVTVRVKTSQFANGFGGSTQAASVFTPPPGAVAVPCQVAEGPPGLGPTVPEGGLAPDVGELPPGCLARDFCAPCPANGMAHTSKMLLKRRSALSVARAFVEEAFFFICSSL